MNIENVRVFGFEPAFRSMRNPKDSWARSDSQFYTKPVVYPSASTELLLPESPVLGPKDLELATALIHGGSEERKFLRLIVAWADLTLPRYLWQELDTYKVSTVRMSCSTMHKMGSRLLTQDDFELPLSEVMLQEVNKLILAFQEAPQEEKRAARRRMKNALPEGYVQRATYLCNYETALAILRQRSLHRLDEWNIEIPGSLCDWLIRLPYMGQFAAAAKK